MGSVSTAALQSIASVTMWIAAVAGAIAVVASLVSTVTANESSSRLQREASQKIAFANARAEAARLRTEELRSQMAWRRLSKSQRSILVARLSGLTAPVWTQFVGRDPEATLFRNELDAALREAGVPTRFFSGWEVAVGLKLAAAPGEERDRIVAAFGEAGIPLQVVELDQLASAPGKDEIKLLVGSKIEGLAISEEGAASQ